MASAPTDIRAVTDRATFEIDWPDRKTSKLPFRFLRGRCPCASCVNEFTGERVVGPKNVAEDIAPYGLDLAGNYALKIRWNDGHDTGLFTWTYLRELSDESAD
ncbi:DUF971 domain-containing protein [Stratiformator vulcanicus]|uniref:Gamma-butyrobetaine dioxygenase n=1 Tax=Stratiformator vulcanicus TaxID=2527980 RepID=A0A517R5M9_9PLAN|nr:DUF971 domain-containing protein [Stratiformator vulcanicus]QDT39182.1 Gamma-butyrobetaine dioxygenase [Stratiformator vulcanicus]